jgi:DedD protein
MAVFDFFSRFKRARPAPVEREEPPLLPRKRTAASAASSGTSAVDQVRRQARQRLIGAAVLLTLGVVAFPVVFETQPRPAVPADLPMRITQGSEAASGVQTQPIGRGAGDPGQPPLAPIGSTAAPLAMGEPVAEPVAGDATPAAAPVGGHGTATAATPPTTESPEERPTGASTKRSSSNAHTPVPAPSPAPQGAPAAADARVPTAQTEGARFIVQVGAFSDAGAVRNLRARIERLGLTTYTQAVDTAGGRRIRVRLGPYDSREEASRALEKLQQSGVTGGMVLSL